MSSNSSQRTRRTYTDIPGMEQQHPDDSPPRSLRGMRTTSMPLAKPELQHSHSYTSQPTQHPNSQNFSMPQFHSDGSSASQAAASNPPLSFPRPIQRVPPPPLLPQDTSRFNSIHDDWTMSDKFIAEINRAAHDQEASIAQPIPKGPVIERERAVGKDSPGDRAGSGGSAGSGPGRRDSLRRTNTSETITPPHTHSPHSPHSPQRPLPTVPSQPSPTYHYPRDDSPHSHYAQSQPRETSPPHYSQPRNDSPHAHYPQPRKSQSRERDTNPPFRQPQPRDTSPPFHYDERASSKVRTPDRSLPVQEENEAEEDITITPGRERERARERERDMDTVKPRTMGHRLPTPQFSTSPMIPSVNSISSNASPTLNLDSISQLNANTSSTTSAISSTGTSTSETSDLDAELSTTVQGDADGDGDGEIDVEEYEREVYENQRLHGLVHDGRSSRAEHRFDDDVEEHRLRAEKGGDRDVRSGNEDQDDTESYTPRSHHASLPQHPISLPSVTSVHPAGGSGPSNAHTSLPTTFPTTTTIPSLAADRDRHVYNAALHFRPRTASSDAGGMVNLDTAMLHDAIERLTSPFNLGQGQSHGQNQAQKHNTSHGQNQHHDPYTPSGAHTALPQRLPTAEEMHALEAWQRHAQTHNYIRPGAPVPPTPPNASAGSLSYSYNANPSSNAYANAHASSNAYTTNANTSSNAHGSPSLSPPPPRATPYPYGYPYQHVLHRSYQSHQPQSQSQLQDPHVLHLLNMGMQTDSTFSPSSTPYPVAAYDYSPFLPEHFRRMATGDMSMSLRSSPSHMPVALPAYTGPGGKKKGVRRVKGRRELASAVRGGKGVRRGVALPPRGESTEPRETSPEPPMVDAEEEEEEGDFEDEFNDLAARLEGGTGSSGGMTTERGGGAGSTAGDGGGGGGKEGGGDDDDDDDWVDEDEEGDEDDLLHLEYHPNFVVNPDKRRKRWELKWDALVKAFQALDRQTDTTLLLLASPSHTKTTFSVRSRSVRRLPSLANSPSLSQIKTSFRALSTARQAARLQTRHMSLAERFERYNSEGSEGGEGREEELKGALGAALSSLSALSSIYEGREQRWRTEMGRMGEERERVEVLLRQALGMGFEPGVLYA